MNQDIKIFDRALVRWHRERAAKKISEYDFLFKESATRLIERLDDVLRDFAVILDLGCHNGLIGSLLKNHTGLRQIIQCDISQRMVQKAHLNGYPSIVADEEWLPFLPASFDLVLSNLSLHWVNDLPGCLAQVKRILKPDGLFLAVMLGGDTLHELRSALSKAEIEEEGGLGLHISPFADIKDLGHLLQRAGFALPVCDRDHIVVHYKNPLNLLADLRGMGESNALEQRRRQFMRKNTLLSAIQNYPQSITEQSLYPASFELLTLTGWA